MKILTRFNTVTLDSGVDVTPVKIETKLYTEASKKIEYGFIDKDGELVRVGGRLLKSKNDLAERVIYQNKLFAEAVKKFPKANLSTQIANELLDLTSQLPRVQASMTRQLKKAFAEYQADMLAAVAKTDIMGVTARRYQEKRALALVKSVREMTTTFYRDIHKASEAQLIDLAGVSADSMVRVVNGVAGGDLLTHTLTSPQLKYLVKHSVIDGATSAEWWGKQAANTQFKFKSVVQDALLKGQGTDVITRSIRGTKANNFTDGFMNTAYNNARSLAHTSVQNVANEARLEVMKENDDVIESIEWLSTLDGHTTPICKALDGLVWDNDHKPVGHKQQWPGSTAHWQCRSTQVPVLKGFSELPKAKQKEMKGKRSSMDGLKSASTDYDSWLKAKDKLNPSFVKNTLGKEKYAIWKAKGLSMTDMVDQYNNPLTVTQLREKFGVVAKKVVVKKAITAKTLETPKSKVVVMPKAKATKILNEQFKVAEADQRYILDTDGGALTRFRPNRRKRGVTNTEIMRGEMGVAKTASLTDESTSVILAMLNDAHVVTGRYGLQPLRGLNTSVTGGAGASMGDGVLSVSAKYFNRNAASADIAASTKKAKALLTKMEGLKKTVFDTKAKMTAITDELGFTYSVRREPGYQALVKEHNKAVNAYNRANSKYMEIAPRSTIPESMGNKWQVGADLSDRPFTAGSYHKTDLDELRSTIFHEMGHHVHQQWRVTTSKLYSSPPLESLLQRLFKDMRTVTPTKYAETNHKEWFAESFALYHNGRKELVDPILVDLIDSLSEPALFDKFMVKTFGANINVEAFGFTR